MYIGFRDGWLQVDEKAEEKNWKKTGLYVNFYFTIWQVGIRISEGFLEFEIFLQEKKREKLH